MEVSLKKGERIRVKMPAAKSHVDIWYDGVLVNATLVGPRMNYPAGHTTTQMNNLRVKPDPKVKQKST